MKDYLEAHKYSFANKNEILKDNKCGCFHCLTIFKTEEIVDWAPDVVHTAICPYCQIDSVIGEGAGYSLTEKFLTTMRDYWFNKKTK